MPKSQNSSCKAYVLVFSMLLGLTCHMKGQKFSKQAVLDDLDYLYQSLEDAHYDLFAYTTREKFDSVYHQIRNSVDSDSLGILEITNQFQRLVSSVNNGHTEIDFPVASYTGYAYEDGTVFPLELAFEDGMALVRKNFSGDSTITRGQQIFSINGLPIQDILRRIYPHISAERAYFKNAKLELYAFPRYYWQVFGKQEHFNVHMKVGSVIKEYNLEAVNLIQGFEMLREDVLNAQMELKYYDNIAYLNPGNFAGDELAYQSFLDSAFTSIKDQSSAQLIIDLRNNAGGNDSFSDYLVSFIASKSFFWNSKFSVKSSRLLKEFVRENNDTTDAYFRKILDTPSGQQFEYSFDEHMPQEQGLRYAGEVYVLVNRQSYSQATVTAAQIQDYGFGTIAGEETGEYPSLYASQFEFSLPNTGIVVKVSKGQIVRVNGSTAQNGVLPDIAIRDHLLDEEDEILNTLLKSLRSE